MPLQLPPNYQPIAYPMWLSLEGCEPLIVADAEEERLHRDRARYVRWERARAVGRERANTVQADRANAFAGSLALTIAEIRTEGIGSLRGIAAALNARCIPSPRGGRWQASQLQRLLRRLKAPPSLPQNMPASVAKVRSRYGKEPLRANAST